MKAPKYIPVVAAALLLGSKAKAQSGAYQESLMERWQKQPTYEEFIVAEVRKFPEVRQKEEDIMRRSGNTHFAIFMVDGDGLGTYTVKIMEDNGKNQVTHMRYVVDSATGKVQGPKK
jgi:hypothetical protein